MRWILLQREYSPVKSTGPASMLSPIHSSELATTNHSLPRSFLHLKDWPHRNVVSMHSSVKLTGSFFHSETRKFAILRMWNRRYVDLWGFRNIELTGVSLAWNWKSSDSRQPRSKSNSLISVWSYYHCWSWSIFQSLPPSWTTATAIHQEAWHLHRLQQNQINKNLKIVLTRGL